MPDRPAEIPLYYEYCAKHDTWSDPDMGGCQLCLAEDKNLGWRDGTVVETYDVPPDFPIT